MLKRHASEIERAQILERQRADGLRLSRNIEDALVHFHRRLGLAIDVDDVAKLLQRSEDEEGIDPQRKELPDGDVAAENQVQHQEKNARAKEVHAGALNEAEASQVFHFLQLQLQNLAGRGVQTLDFLLSQPE